MALATACLFAAPARANAGRLESVRSEVRDSSSSSSSYDSSSDSSTWDDDDSTESSLGSLRDLDVSLTEAPKYRRFPYADAGFGYIYRGSEFSSAVPGPDESQPVVMLEDDPPRSDFSGTAHVEGAYLYDQLYRSAFGIDLNYWRLGLSSDLSFFLEGPFKDALYLGSTNAKFALVMRPAVRWRIGGGAQYMIDGRVPGEGRREYAAGGNFTTDVDVFPFWPVVLSGRFDYGRLYRTRSMLGRATVGVMLSRFELYAGYEARKIGKVSLHGPMVGLRAWF